MWPPSSPMTSSIHQPRSRGRRCASVGAVLGAVALLVPPAAWACPSCAAGDTSAAIGDGWMVALLGLPVTLLVAALFLVRRLSAQEEREP